MNKPKFTRSRIQEILISAMIRSVSFLALWRSMQARAMAAALAAGETVELRGLGTLDVRERAERRAHKPRTGEAVIVPARRYVFFIPGRELKAALRKPAENPGSRPSPECP